MSLLSPHMLPSGNRILLDSGEADDLQRRLTHGDPTWGWEGDDSLVLSLYENPDTGDWRWEVLVDLGNRGSYVACRGPWNTRLNPNVILRLLVEADTRKSDPIAASIANNEQVRRDRESAEDEQIEDFADRLYSALRRDGAHRL